MFTGSDSQPLQTFTCKWRFAYIFAGFMQTRMCGDKPGEWHVKEHFTLPHFDGSSLLLCQQPSLVLLNAYQLNLSYQLNKKTHHSTEASWFQDIVLFLLTSGNYEITCERLPHFQLHSVLPGLSLAPPPLNQHYIVKKLRTITTIKQM